MPILERNRGLYPGDWKVIVAEVLERDGHCCKFCGAPNHWTREDTGIRVVLTTAHLDHNPANNGTPGDRPNLAALCQRCHNRHDAPHRQETRRETKRLALEEAGQGDIFSKGEGHED